MPEPSRAAPSAERALKEGDPRRALALLQEQVRARPGDAALRVFLFQLLCVLGQWERALNQLTVAGELDAGALAMVQTYRETIRCERLREEVFLGRKAPLLFGEPEPWIALLIEALAHDGRGEADDARRLRDQAFGQAPVCAGQADGQPFEWIADADMRLGPVLEAVINGRYYWVPFARLAAASFEPPTDLRDTVWTPAQLTFANGGATVAFVPTRYAGTDLADGALALARRTEWREPVPGLHVGAGQRMFATEAVDLPLRELRTIAFDVEADGSGDGAAAA